MPEQITEQMIEAGIEAFGPFDRDAYEMRSREALADMVKAVYAAMASVRAGATVKDGALAGKALYPFPTSL